VTDAALVSSLQDFVAQLFQIALEEFPSVPEVAAAIGGISTLLCDSADKSIIEFMDMHFSPAVELESAVDRYMQLGEDAIRRIEADADFDVYQTVSRARQGMNAISGTELPPSVHACKRIDDLKTRVTQILAEAAELGLEEKKNPLEASSEKAKALLDNNGHWADGFTKDTDWDICFGQANATFLSFEPHEFKAMADTLNAQILALRKMHAKLDRGDTPLIDFAAKQVLVLRRLYAEGLFCGIFAPPLDDEMAEQRKKSVHKVMKLVADTEGLTWKMLALPIQARAILAKQLE
jgi:hypothetical protein